MQMLRHLLCGFAIFTFGTFNHPLQAQTLPEAAPGAGTVYGIRLGLLVHDIGGLWSQTRAEGGADVNAEIAFRKPSFILWEGAILPNFGLSINSQGDTTS